MRVARSCPTAPASLLYAVAKWLCQKSAIFSSSGRSEWIMRNSQRWRASLINVLAENGWPPAVVMPTYAAWPIFES